MSSTSHISEAARRTASGAMSPVVVGSAYRRRCRMLGQEPLHPVRDLRQLGWCRHVAILDGQVEQPVVDTAVDELAVRLRLELVDLRQQLGRPLPELGGTGHLHRDPVHEGDHRPLGHDVEGVAQDRGHDRAVSVAAP
ncbi:hypothetical protein [Streptomyces sp. NPDC048636]|uniref:hypothetical protein n=1 Tax=Streptomyces sp. NPDC048636 TaxID=3155762 RepID=UPI003443721A